MEWKKKRKTRSLNLDIFLCIEKRERLLSLPSVFESPILLSNLHILWLVTKLKQESLPTLIFSKNVDILYSAGSEAYVWSMTTSTVWNLDEPDFELDASEQ